MAPQPRLYVGGLPYDVEADDLAELFRPYGDLRRIEVRVDSLTRRPKGFAFVEFKDPVAAANAAAALNGTDMRGRNILVNVQREYEPRPLPPHWSVPEADAGAENGAFRSATLPQSIALPISKPILSVAGRVTDELVARLAANPDLLKTRQIDSRLFEELVAELWAGFGYDVELTKKTRDGGRDIIAIRSHLVNERYLIECKHPTRDRPVGVQVVRELYGILQHERATKAILATTHRFTRDATLFIEDHRWELDGKDFDGLREWLLTYLRLKQ